MSKHHKQCIGVLFIGFLLFIIIVIPASASSTVEGLILSTGYITYDPDADGVPEMAFCSDDLKKIGKGVDALNNNISVFTDKYDELATTSEEYREELMAIMMAMKKERMIQLHYKMHIMPARMMHFGRRMKKEKGMEIYSIISR